MSCGPEDLELSVLGWQELGRSYPNNGDAWSPQWRSKAGGVRRFVRRVAAHSCEVGLQMPWGWEQGCGAQRAPGAEPHGPICSAAGARVCNAALGGVH